MKKILVASHNAGKLREIKAILEPMGYEVQSAADKDLPEPVEDGATFLDNARIKARAAVKALGIPVLADDSGLEIPALNGAPGVDTKPITENLGGHGKAVAHFAMQTGTEIYEAQYYCCMVVCFPDGREIIGEGIVKGHLHPVPKGDGGFGYDPWFVPEGETRSYAQMPADEKARTSHRAQALSHVVQQLKDAGELRAVS